MTTARQLRSAAMSTPAEGAARRDNVEQVYRRVREAILEGEIAPGAVMSQVALADELGVSRTPLREALRMLQSEGLVDAQANRRVTVRPISATDLEELVVMRVALETEADPAVGLAAGARGRSRRSRAGWRRWRTSPRPRTTSAGRSRTPRSTAASTAPAGERVNADAGAALRSLRALPARAHRALAEGVADRRAPRDPRRLQGAATARRAGGCWPSTCRRPRST